MMHFEDIWMSIGARCGSNMYLDGYEESSGTMTDEISFIGFYVQTDFASGHGL